MRHRGGLSGGHKEVTFNPFPSSPGIEIDGNYAKVAWFSRCGNCPDETMAQGFMIRKGDRIELFKRIRMTPELEKTPSGFITVMSNGQLRFETSDSHGPLVLEFQRVSNAPTVLDLFGWD